MKPTLVEEIRSRYGQILEKIDMVSGSVGRQPGSVRLVVVTKTHPLESVLAALEAGVRDLGENYAEEAAAKISAIGAIHDLAWHMIGHVQSRKAELVVQNFDFVHSIDSFKLASRLDRFASEVGRTLPVLLECNVSGEESKFGFPVYEKPLINSFLTEAEKIAQLSHLDIRGLMTMPPLYDDPEKTRPYFQRLSELRSVCIKQIPKTCWQELSMGTSADFPAAVEEGATIIRVGTAIMGPRPLKA